MHKLCMHICMIMTRTKEDHKPSLKSLCERLRGKASGSPWPPSMDMYGAVKKHCRASKPVASFRRHEMPRLCQSWQ